MPGMNDLLVKMATDAHVARKFRDNPASVIKDAGLTNIEESVILSRDPRLIQSTLQSAALKDSLAAAADDTVWTVVVVL